MQSYFVSKCKDTPYVAYLVAMLGTTFMHIKVPHKHMPYPHLLVGIANRWLPQVWAAFSSHLANDWM